jgi:hypothetical protein
MDWTTMGAPPPMGTPPIIICRVFRLDKKVQGNSFVIFYPTRFENDIHQAQEKIS